MKKLALIALLLATPMAHAAELTLNDLPSVLNTLRECKDVKGYLGGVTQTCTVRRGDVVALLRDDGLTIAYENRGLKLYGRGKTVGQAVGDLARQMNEAGADSKRAVEALAPMLPTQ